MVEATSTHHGKPTSDFFVAITAVRDGLTAEADQLSKERVGRRVWAVINTQQPGGSNASRIPADLINWGRR